MVDSVPDEITGSPHQDRADAEQIYARVIELPIEARADFLEAACEGSPELEAEVRSLLCHAESADAFFGRLGERLQRAWPRHYLPEPLGALPPGAKVGHYRIEEPIGFGGMGTVYRARDSRLDREVALKFLPRHLESDPQARQRLLVEARAVAALDHLNICTIYEVDQTDSGQLFLAMALYRGETLKERLTRGLLPVQEAVGVGAQIASALAAAHAQGIVHRDVKPANVILTRDGVAKLLDFGIAKLASLTMTGPGVTPGTVAYMSPEQVRGEPVDHRTDLWSLGVVFYEMLAGTRPFAGESDRATTHPLVNEELRPLHDIRPEVPVEVDRVVWKLLRGDPQQRYQHADEVPVDLRHATADRSPRATMEQRPAASTSIRKRLVWTVVTAGALVAAGAITAVRGGYLATVEPVDRPTVVQFSTSLPEGQSLVVDRGSSVAISPDGTQLVYAALTDDTSRLYHRPLNRLEALEIPGTRGASQPFFSPDGAWVGFFAAGELRRVPLSGGAPQAVARVSMPVRGASWGRDGALVYAGGTPASLFRIPAVGGRSEPIADRMQHLESDEETFAWPQTIPELGSILFTTWDLAGLQRIALLDLATGLRRTLVGHGTHARHVDGHLVYAAGGDLLAARMSRSAQELSEVAVPVLGGVLTDRSSAAHFALSETGTLVYVPGQVAKRSVRLVWVDRGGRVDPLPLPPADYRRVRVSPDGRRLVYAIPEVRHDLWIYDLERRTSRRLTGVEGNEYFSAWGLDGRDLFVASDRHGTAAANIYRIVTDGSGAAERLTDSELDQPPYSLSPDGSAVFYVEGRRSDTGFDIWMLPLQGEHNPVPVLATPYDEINPTISADGQWLAYASNDTGRWEIYLRSIINPAEVVRVSADGGAGPLWSRDGSTLFYRSGGSRMMAVPVTTRPILRVGDPQLLFDLEGSYHGDGELGRGWDLAPDGRFLLLRNEEMEERPTRYHVAVGWGRDLRAAVSSGR